MGHGRRKILANMMLYFMWLIAHIKETKENQGLYYKVNRDLAYETAKKAKADGVKQFFS